MKIFIDSARLDEIEEAYSYGIIDGVTTNPSLLKKAVNKIQETDKEITIEEYIKKVLRVAKGTPVSLEVTEYTADKMIEQAEKLYKIFNPVADNVVIKIPVNPTFKDNKNKNFDGINAIRNLSSKGIPVNCTLVFTPEQALLAAKAGAKFVSPFAGRVDDYIRNNNGIDFEKHDYFPAEGYRTEEGFLHNEGIFSGIDLVEKIMGIMEIYEMETEVLAASIRNVRQAREAALAGADVATLPYKVISKLLIHYKTQEGMKRFTEDVVPEYAELTK
ncbi:MAG: transaldolase family protein [Candidatus Thermoplasmatota archaeon]